MLLFNNEKHDTNFSKAINMIFFSTKETTNNHCKQLSRYLFFSKTMCMIHAQFFPETLNIYYFFKKTLNMKSFFSETLNILSLSPKHLA